MARRSDKQAAHPPPAVSPAMDSDALTKAVLAHDAPIAREAVALTDAYIAVLAALEPQGKLVGGMLETMVKTVTIWRAGRLQPVLDALPEDPDAPLATEPRTPPASSDE